jgi:hypothetical protein
MASAARADPNGRFTVPNVAPGEWSLSVSSRDPKTDPEFLKTIEPVATAFTLGDGERKALNLKLTKIGSGNER